MFQLASFLNYFMHRFLLLTTSASACTNLQSGRASKNDFFSTITGYRHSYHFILVLGKNLLSVCKHNDGQRRQQRLTLFQPTNRAVRVQLTTS